MPLIPSGVQLIYLSNGQPVTWSLNVESIDSTLNRTVAIIPLPSPDVAAGTANPFQNRPIAWALDLGMIAETIILHGATKDNDSDTATPTIAELDEICRCVSTGLFSAIGTGTYGTTINNFAGVALLIDLGPGQGSGQNTRMFTVQQPTYQGTILTFTKHRIMGETVWTWEMTFGVINWNQSNFVNGNEQ